jgi:signal recognition particle GTPase
MLPHVIGVEQSQLTTCALSQALLELKELLRQFQKSQGGGVMKRMLHFLSAQGFRQQFEEQEQELRDCLVQLSAILNTAQFTSQVRAAAAVASPQRLRSVT